MSIEQIETETASATRERPRSTPLRRLLRDPQAAVTGSILLIGLILAAIAPWISPHDPNVANLEASNYPPGTAGYLLGADASGRDILSRLLASNTTSFISGFIGASVATVVGVIFGLIGGYFGPKTRFGVEWLFNLLMTFPGVLLLIVLMPVTKGDYRVTMFVFGVLLSPNIYRIVRNLVAGTKKELFIDAAQVSGLSTTRILGRHVLFVIRGPIIISVAFLFGGAVAVQSGLAFLGIGSTSVPSFGSMTSDAFANFYADPIQVLWPSAALGLLTASVVLFGNSLRDALQGARPRAMILRSRVPDRMIKSDPVRDGAGVALLEVRNLAITYRSAEGQQSEVVSNVDITVHAGEVMGLVGESGSGKTQTAFAILGVLPPEATIVRGSIKISGVDVVGLGERDLRSIRGREVAYIPQEPMSNLDPSFTVGAQLSSSLRAVRRLSPKASREEILALLARVGIPDPERTYRSYPHEISGGMAQRVLIAGAVASRPKLLIADEPTTSLDVTVQAEILDLLRGLQSETGIAVLLVTHNFGVVADLCEKISVMRAGRIVETGTTLQVFRNPKHEYTKRLLAAILDDDRVRKDAPDSEGRMAS